MDSEASATPDLQAKEIDTQMLNSQVIIPFCVSWSPDNKISIIAEGGVYVYELWPTSVNDQHTITFKKSWIPTPSTLPLANTVVNNKNDCFLWNLDRKEAFETTMNTTLSSIIQRQHFGSSVAQMIQCEFSPLINNKSYLSCLTNKGQLDVYEKSLKNWLHVINITNLWISHCQTEATSTNISFKDFKSKMYELKISAIKWCKEPEMIFLTCHDNGRVVTWNVKYSQNTLEMSVRHSICMEGKPCCLQVTPLKSPKEALLIAGFISGVVKCSNINLVTGVENNSFYLWDNKDFLSPSKIHFKYVNGKLFIITAKRYVLLVQSLSPSNLEVQSTNWHEYPTTIISLNEYYEDLIVGLQNHDVYKLAMRDNEDFFNQIIDMGVKVKQKMSYNCYGLCMSQNKAIWILISSPKVNYDLVKEITQMIIFSPVIKTYKALSYYTGNELIESIVETYKSARLCEIFDLLEIKKLELVSDNSKFKETYEVTESLSLLELQLMLWEVKLKLVCNLIEDESVINEVEMAIAKKSAEKIVYLYGNIRTLPELKKRALTVCKNFLKDSMEKCHIVPILCAICGEDSYMENIKISSCVNSHNFPRCSLSLLPCDAIPYVICRNCDLVALPDFILDCGTNCPYCDDLLELDSRLTIRN